MMARNRPGPIAVVDDKMGPHLPADPRDWPDAVKLAHAHRMAERTMDRHPGIAAAWLRTIDIIQARQGNHG
jgi:hypothetical protein